MRSSLSFFGSIALGSFALCALSFSEVLASVPSIVPASAKVEEPASLPQSGSVRIAPHRAIYQMKLSSAKNGSNVSDVSGRMVFEWRDVCDGWAIQQRLQLHFSYADGSDQNLVSTELTWESKDSKRYSFNIRRITDGQETEVYRGKAVQNNDGIILVSYSAPEGISKKLPAGTLFPSAHTLLILQNALKGEKFFSRLVFDGSDDVGSSNISAFILPRRTLKKEPEPITKAKKNPLLVEAAWPVHLAFFKIDTETGESDYEMDINLLPNGVAEHMNVDYGDFSITGNLEEAQALQTLNCP
ncbi:MAG: cell envelope integrity EipB family protein [Bdellovibrionales bacterium]